MELVLKAQQGHGEKCGRDRIPELKLGKSNDHISASAAVEDQA